MASFDAAHIVSAVDQIRSELVEEFKR